MAGSWFRGFSSESLKKKNTQKTWALLLVFTDWVRRDFTNPVWGNSLSRVLAFLGALAMSPWKGMLAPEANGKIWASSVSAKVGGKWDQWVCEKVGGACPT